jgi:hypothetical protein
MALFDLTPRPVSSKGIHSRWRRHRDSAIRRHTSGGPGICTAQYQRLNCEWCWQQLVQTARVMTLPLRSLVSAPDHHRQKTECPTEAYKSILLVPISAKHQHPQLQSWPRHGGRDRSKQRHVAAGSPFRAFSFAQKPQDGRLTHQSST